MTDRPIYVRVAVAEERLDTLEEEQLRQRDRLHALENDRATIRLLAEQITQLSQGIERIAKRAAQDAIDMAMDHRDEIGRRRWGLRIQWVAAGIAGGGFVSAIVFQLVN